MTQKKTTKKATPKTTPEKAVVAPKEEKKVEQPIVEKTRICDACGKEFSSKFSGQKYCATCSVDKAKERRKAAQKRRKMHRKDELQDLRQLKQDIIAALAGKDAIAKIKALVE